MSACGSPRMLRGFEPASPSESFRARTASSMGLTSGRLLPPLLPASAASLPILAQLGDEAPSLHSLVDVFWREFEHMANARLAHLELAINEGATFATALGIEENAEFRQHLEFLHALCDESALINPICERLLHWMDELSLPPRAVVSGSPRLPSHHHHHHQATALSSFDGKTELVAIGKNVLALHALRRILRSSGNETRLTSHVMERILTAAIARFDRQEQIYGGEHTGLDGTVADLAAEIVGLLSEVAFTTVSERLVQYISELEDSSVAQMTVISCLKYLRIKLYPAAALNNCFHFLQQCCELFLSCKKSECKHAWALLFVELLVPVAAHIAKEVNLLMVRKFVVKMYDATAESFKKSKHVALKQAYLQLLTALLCISQADFFQQHWESVLNAAISNLKAAKQLQDAALDAIYRLVWVYMVRIKGEGQKTEAKIKFVLDSLFPPGSKTIICRDASPLIYVRILQFIAHERSDIVFRFILHEIGADRPNSLNLNPERMIIAIRAAVAIANQAQSKEEQPSMPLMFERASAMGGTGTSNATELRSQRLLTTSFLTPEAAAQSGLASYLDPLRKQLAAILTQLDALIVQPYLLTRSGDEVSTVHAQLLTQHRRLLELYRNALLAVPRFFDLAHPTTDVIDFVLHGTIHVDAEVRRLASTVLQCMLRNHPGQRASLMQRLVGFFVHTVPFGETSSFEVAVKILIYTIRQWTRTLDEEAIPPDGANKAAAVAAGVVGSEIIAPHSDLIDPSFSSMSVTGPISSMQGYEPAHEDGTAARPTGASSPRVLPLRLSRRRLQKMQEKRTPGLAVPGVSGLGNLEEHAGTHKSTPTEFRDAMIAIEAFLLVSLFNARVAIRKLALLAGRELHALTAALKRHHGYRLDHHCQLHSCLRPRILRAHRSSTEAHHQQGPPTDVTASLDVAPPLSPFSHILDTSISSLSRATRSEGALSELMTSGTPGSDSPDDLWTQALCQVLVEPATRSHLTMLPRAWMFAAHMVHSRSIISDEDGAWNYEKVKLSPQVTTTASRSFAGLLSFLFAVADLVTPDPHAQADPYLDRYAPSQAGTGLNHQRPDVPRTAADMFQYVAPFMKSDQAGIPRAIVFGCSVLASSLVPRWLHAVSPYLREVTDVRSESSRKKRRRDALRFTVCNAQLALSAAMGRCLDRQGLEGDEILATYLHAYFDGLRIFFEMSEHSDDAAIQRLRALFFKTISCLSDAITVESVHTVAFPATLRHALYALCVKHASTAAYALPPTPGTTDALRASLAISACEAVAHLCRGPAFEPEASLITPGYLRHFWLDALKSGVEPVCNAAQTGLFWLCYCNSEPAVGVLTWVTDLAYTLKHSRGRDACFAAMCQAAAEKSSSFLPHVQHFVLLSLFALAEDATTRAAAFRALAHLAQSVLPTEPYGFARLVFEPAREDIDVSAELVLVVNEQMTLLRPDWPLAVIAELVHRLAMAVPAERSHLARLLTIWCRALPRHAASGPVDRRRWEAALVESLLHLSVRTSDLSVAIAGIFADWGTDRGQWSRFVMTHALSLVGQFRNERLIGVVRGVLHAMAAHNASDVLDCLVEAATNENPTTPSMQSPSSRASMDMSSATVEAGLNEGEPADAFFGDTYLDIPLTNLRLQDLMSFSGEEDECYCPALLFLADLALQHPRQSVWMRALPRLVHAAVLRLDHPDAVLRSHVHDVLRTLAVLLHCEKQGGEGSTAGNVTGPGSDGDVLGFASRDTDAHSGDDGVNSGTFGRSLTAPGTPLTPRSLHRSLTSLGGTGLVASPPGTDCKLTEVVQTLQLADLFGEDVLGSAALAIDTGPAFSAFCDRLCELFEPAAHTREAPSLADTTMGRPDSSSVRASSFRELWGVMALRQAVGSSITQLALRSFRVVQLLLPPFSLKQLSDMLVRLADVAGNTLRDAQMYVSEVTRTIGSFIADTRTQPSQYGRQIQRTAVSHVFWAAVALLESNVPTEFEAGASLLLELLKAATGEGWDNSGHAADGIFDEETAHLICELKDKVEQDVELPDVVLLCLRGPFAGCPPPVLLELLTLLAENAHSDILGSNDGQLFLVLTLTSSLAPHLDDIANAPALERRCAAALSRLCQPRSSRLGRVFQLFADGTYPKDGKSWLGDFAKFFAGAFFPDLELPTFMFLVRLLDRHPAGRSLGCLDVISALMQAVRAEGARLRPFAADVAAVVVRLQRDHQWSEATMLMTAGRHLFNDSELPTEEESADSSNDHKQAMQALSTVVLPFLGSRNHAHVGSSRTQARLGQLLAAIGHQQHSQSALLFRATQEAEDADWEVPDEPETDPAAPESDVEIEADQDLHEFFNDFAFLEHALTGSSRDPLDTSRGDSPSETGGTALSPSPPSSGPGAAPDTPPSFANLPTAAEAGASTGPGGSPSIEERRRRLLRTARASSSRHSRSAPSLSMRPRTLPEVPGGHPPSPLGPGAGRQSSSMDEELCSRHLSSLPSQPLDELDWMRLAHSMLLHMDRCALVNAAYYFSHAAEVLLQRHVALFRDVLKMGLDLDTETQTAGTSVMERLTELPPLPMIIMRDGVLDDDTVRESLVQVCYRLQDDLETYVSRREEVSVELGRLRASLRRRESAHRLPAASAATSSVLKHGLCQDACKLTHRMTGLLGNFSRVWALFGAYCVRHPERNKSVVIQELWNRIVRELDDDCVPIMVDSQPLSADTELVALQNNLEGGNIKQAQRLLRGFRAAGADAALGHQQLSDLETLVLIAMPKLLSGGADIGVIGVPQIQYNTTLETLERELLQYARLLEGGNEKPTLTPFE
ncbi:uncharacterized protein MONBRDRAFT_22972 [Monosiga brevicollis MX1]|uniref:Uncharacterized protein n=1 Tax=Monosiga brevicollis TaxID=81824 RepID=A9USM3_MONBE|nr:uncharacterized protein MONBRDRAFT_22972 [Monosiga brevicollis MX1]EDQ92126.1 predicted protein [Monosiga brevicollis MX1]|eukprot:XP_001743412.1 hypothetical protein [Monosiga brevicollis MX1]